MTRTVYLHIGMPKAASTSIQKALFGYSDDTVRYPDLDGSNHSTLLYEVFNQREQPHFRMRRQGRSPEWIAENKARMTAQFEAELTKDSRDLILSGEVISNFKTNELEDMIATLQPHFDEMKVIAYARRPVEYTSSVFQQFLKSGKADFKLNPPNYVRYFKKFLDLFGSENVSVKMLLPEALIEGDVIRDFCHQVGIDANKIQSKRSNESLCAEVVAMFYFWNRDGFAYEGDAIQSGASRDLIKELQTVTGTKFRLPHAMVMEALKPNRVPWFEKTFGVDCTELVDPGPGYTLIGSEEELAALATRSSAKLDPLLAKHSLNVASQASGTVKFNALYAKLLVDRLTGKTRRSALPPDLDEPFIDTLPVSAKNRRI